MRWVRPAGRRRRPLALRGPTRSDRSATVLPHVRAQTRRPGTASRLDRTLRQMRPDQRTRLISNTHAGDDAVPNTTKTWKTGQPRWPCSNDLGQLSNVGSCLGREAVAHRVPHHTTGLLTRAVVIASPVQHSFPHNPGKPVSETRACLGRSSGAPADRQNTLACARACGSARASAGQTFCSSGSRVSGRAVVALALVEMGKRLGWWLVVGGGVRGCGWRSVDPAGRWRDACRGRWRLRRRR